MSMGIKWCSPFLCFLWFLLLCIDRFIGFLVSFSVYFEFRVVLATFVGFLCCKSENYIWIDSSKDIWAHELISCVLRVLFFVLYLLCAYMYIYLQHFHMFEFLSLNNFCVFSTRIDVFLNEISVLYCFFTIHILRKSGENLARHCTS